MMFQPGSLRNRVIRQSEAHFSLKGMIAPSFQNDGTAYVIIDGRMILPGESYVVNVPGVVLTNTIAIQFEEDPAKSKVLNLGYVSLDDQN